MEKAVQNKRKLINDPVYGFIGIPSDFLFDLISHPWFQRLRNIRQLGLTQLVYPGAVHTRFHHALGSMHLASEALEVIKIKGAVISEEESEGLLAAILLHDLGHGPFSHTLEGVLIKGMHHETMTLLMMDKLNKIFQGKMSTAIKIFSDQHDKRFLHQMVSGQLDMDRMDYLNRDSFFTGVSEGHISSERLLKMLRVSAGRLVLEEKSVYSIENFLVSRRLMYWQVYYHKTVIAAEQMLVRIIDRARELVSLGVDMPCSESLELFLNYKGAEGKNLDEEIFDAFTELDDHDIWSAIKSWKKHPDKVLSLLSNSLINRKLYHVEIRNSVIGEEEIFKEKEQLMKRLDLKPEEVSYFVFTGRISNRAYNHEAERIEVVQKNGKITEFSAISDYFNAGSAITSVEKYFLCAFRNELYRA